MKPYVRCHSLNSSLSVQIKLHSFALKLNFTDMFSEITKMRQGFRCKKQVDVRLQVDPDSPGRILISANENEAEDSLRYRRRTTSFKGRRPAEKRRASLPSFYRMNAKPTTSKPKNTLQKIGSRLAKIGDEFARRNRHYKGTDNSCRSNAVARERSEGECETLEQYARQLADIGDYLNALHSNETSLTHSENYYTSLAENCLVLTSILIGLRNNNIVIISTSDLNTLSSICRVHRAKSVSRARK